MNDNKLIAEFMGIELKPNECGRLFRYHKEWDWLMPVIEKILDNAFYDVGLTSMEDFYSIKENIPYMDETYKSVVKFIKTYNDER